MALSNGSKRRGGKRRLAGSILTLTLTSLLCGLSAHAQTATIDAGAEDPPTSTFSSDTALISPCSNTPGDACMLVAAFKSNLAGYWYISGSSTNGIGALHIFFYVNGVYDATYKTNSVSNPGAITVLGVLGTTYTFQGTEAEGSCTNQAYYQQGWTVGYSYSDGEAYTLGIPYSCS